MHTLAAFSLNQTNGVTYGSLAAVSDQSLTPAQSAGYILPKNMRVNKAFVAGVNLIAARINAPSMRNILLPELYPGLPSATVTSRPPIIDFGMQGPVVQANEALTIDTSSGGAAAGIITGALWLYDVWTPAPGGQIFTALATCANTLIANQWTLGPLVFNQSLPSGQYAVVGMDVISATAALARLVFPGQSQWRPGCVSQLAYGNLIQPSYFRFGEMGLLGTFYNTAQPQLEIFGLSAGAVTATAYIDLIKVSS